MSVGLFQDLRQEGPSKTMSGGIMRRGENGKGKFQGKALLEAYGAVGPLLSVMFSSSIVGVSVIDAQMRFRAINGTLAAMNGVPTARHVGRKLRYVLGAASPKIESAMKQVLETQEPVFLELRAKLPLRSDVGHWVENFLPVRDADGRVTHVAVVVLEITGKRNLERSLHYMIGNLSQIETALRTELQCARMMAGRPDEPTRLLPRAIELVEDCILEAQHISEIARSVCSVNVPQISTGAQELLAPGGDTMSSTDACDREENQRARQLSPRERKVLQLLAECKTNKEVAATLGISVRTAETYRARIMLKLELHSIGNLVRFAVRNKIIEA